jgi:hypothetical protein
MVNLSDGDAAGSAGTDGSGRGSGTAAAAGATGSGAATATGAAAGATSIGGRSATGGSATGGSGGTASGGVTGSSGTTGSGASAAATGSGGDEGIAGSGASSSAGAGGSVVQTEPCAGFPPDPADPACTEFVWPAQPVPVDMLVLLDRGLGMFELLWESEHTPWETVSLALEQLAQEPEAESLGVGLELFSYRASLDHPVECDPASYADPPIKIEPLADTIGAITDTLATTSGGGLAPIYAALEGALQYAVGHTAIVTGRATAVVLITDGPPSQCDEQSVEAIAELAHVAYQEHRVLTFPIGLTSHVENLEPIAQAGGTRAAILIEGGNTTEQLLDALLGIATTPLSCAYLGPAPPPGEDIDAAYAEARLLYTPPGGDAEQVPRLAGPESCADSLHGGWFLEDPVSSATIRVCACTCNRFDGGTIEVGFGCAG